MRRTCRTRKSDLSVPIRLAGDTRAQDRLEDDGGRQLSPKVMLPGAAGADRACTGGRARHDLRGLRQEGRDEETSLLLPSVAVPTPGCSGPPTGPPPPALLQCTPVGGRSGPAVARSRPAMLTETKKKASGARDLEFRERYGAWCGWALREPICWVSAWSSALSAAGRRWWLTGGTTTFLSSSSSCFFFFCIILF